MDNTEIQALTCPQYRVSSKVVEIDLKEAVKNTATYGSVKL